MALQFPAIFLLSTHLQPAEQHELEETIPTLTYDVNEAEVVLGRISRRERAMFELRRLQLDTEPISKELRDAASRGSNVSEQEQPDAKRQKVSPSETKGERSKEGIATNAGETVKVLRLAWLTDSIEQGILMPMADYIVYEGVKRAAKTAIGESDTRSVERKLEPGRDILERAAEDYHGADSMQISPRRVLSKGAGEIVSGAHPGRGRNKPATLARESTSDHDVLVPEIPEYLHTTYSCERPSPVSPPNLDFIEELKRIRLLRLLQGDQIGVRAYSTSISALTAYPRHVQSPQGSYDTVERKCWKMSD